LDLVAVAVGAVVEAEVAGAKWGTGVLQGPVAGELWEGEMEHLGEVPQEGSRMITPSILWTQAYALKILFEMWSLLIALKNILN